MESVMRNKETRKVEEAIRLLENPSALRWLYNALLVWSMIVIVIGIATYFDRYLGYAASFVLYVVAALVIGPMRHAIALLGHEGAHGLISKNKKVNDFLAEIFSFYPSFVRMWQYALFHNPHHTHLGSVLDGELHHKEVNKENWNLPMTKSWMIKRIILDMVGMGYKEVFTIIKFVGTPKNVKDVLYPLLWWTVVLGLVTYFGGLMLSLKVLFIWNLSMFTSFMAVFRLRMWIEHLGTSDTHRISATWWQEVLYLHMYAKGHWEHHRYPKVPFFNLPKVRKLIGGPPIRSVSEVIRGHYMGTEIIKSGQPYQVV